MAESTKSEISEDEIAAKAEMTDYYRRAYEGYWGFLEGRCHYGYTPDDHKGKFDMREAQLAMERKLGKTLGLGPGAKILDAGCGWGHVGRLLTEEFDYDVTGIDYDVERVRTAQKLNLEEEVSMGVARADYQRLPFSDNSFDGIYTMETLVHAYSLDVVLSEFKRVLKPGGKLVLFEYSIPPLDSVPTLPRYLAKKVIEFTSMTSLPKFTHGSFPEILTAAGFENAEAEEISKNVYKSWKHLFGHANGEALDNFVHLKWGLKYVPGSVFIWPARKELGYNICQAYKPMD